jgi:hypothetical protein
MEQKEKLSHKVGDTIEKVGHKVSDMGATRLGDAISKGGDKVEHMNDEKPAANKGKNW